MVEYITEEISLHNFEVDYLRVKRTGIASHDARNHLFGRLPEYMRYIRQQAQRMTQEKFAEELGVDPSYISKLENGHMQPGDDFLDKLHRFVSKLTQDV